MKGAETVASQPEKRLIAQLVHVAFPETQGFVKGRLELNPLGSVKGAVLDNATSSLVIVQRDSGFVNRGGHRHRGVNRVHPGLDPTGPRQVYLPEGIKTRKCTTLLSVAPHTAHSCAPWDPSWWPSNVSSI